MIKKWMFSNKNAKLIDEARNGMGYCYAVRFKVMPGFYLTKIGATRSFKVRFTNIPRAKIYCISPPHYNYFENEELLHKAFAEYRIPRKPNGKAQVELFNIDIPYFLKNMPDLHYETNLENCEIQEMRKGITWYKKK